LSDWVERGIFVGLALMLAYIVFVVIRFSRRYYLARRESRALVHDSWRVFQRRQRSIIADLSRGLRTLRAIAVSAPFLGLAATSYWISGGLFFGYSGSPTRVFDLIEARTASSLLTAATAILVAIPAILTHNFLRMRTDEFERELSTLVPAGMASREDEPNPRPFRFAQALPLKKRFSGLPPFALIAAPALASIVAMFMVFEPYETPTGLDVGLATQLCESGGDNRLIVLRITDTGKLFINFEEVDWNNLAGRLSAIYSRRAQRTLYLSATDGVPFQTLADAIDVIENTPVASPNSPISVLLITPKCFDPKPIAIPLGRHASK